MAAEDTSTREERERLIAEALAHAEVRDLVYRPPTEITPTGRWRGALAVLLLSLSGVLAAAPPVWLAGPPHPSVSDQERERGARIALALQAAHIEAFRQRNQRLPDTLAELGTVIPGVRFVRSGERVYQLVAYGPEGRPIVWESVRPSPEITAAAAPLLGGVDGP